MDDSTPRDTLPKGRPRIVLWVCFAAAALSSVLAGYTYPSGAELGGAFLFLAFFLFALAALQIRQLSALTDRLEEKILNAEQAATSERHVQDNVQDLIESISDGFVLWDGDNRLTMHNQQATIAKSNALYIGMPFEEYVKTIFPEIDPRTTGGDLNAWVKTRQQWFDDAGTSHEVLLNTGIWMMLTERHTRDGGTVTIYTDITETKRAEELRDVSERRLAHAQKLARIGIFEWDATGSNIYWSDIMYDILGLSPGSPPLEFSQYLLLVRAENRDLVGSTFRRLLTFGGKYNQEYEIVRPDGQIRAVRAEAEAITNDRGEVIRILGSVHDQTGAKRVETALRRAKETAVDASNAKSEFLANVSHELRTPLNAIIGFSDVMTREMFGPIGSDRYRDYATDIRESGIHLLGIINDLLDYSKLEAGRLEIHTEKISLIPIIDKCVRMMRRSAEAENVTLVAKFEEIDDSILGDEQKLTQIVLNLVSNAIKFTPAAGVVTVSMEKSGDGIDIVVTDTGIGMSAEDIELALAPFGQVDSTLNRRHMGTGLGLPLSKSLAELHGGTIRIESVPGEGTSVTVHLLHKPPTAEAAPALRLVMGGQAG